MELSKYSQCWKQARSEDVVIVADEQTIIFQVLHMNMEEELNHRQCIIV